MLLKHVLLFQNVLKQQNKTRFEKNFNHCYFSGFIQLFLF